MFREHMIKIAAIIAGGLTIGLVGCTQYFAQRDTITLGVGDSVASNKVIHTIDPWPPGVSQRHHHTSADRLSSAIDTYLEGPKSTNKSTSKSAPPTSSQPSSSAAKTN